MEENSINKVTKLRFGRFWKRLGGAVQWKEVELSMMYLLRPGDLKIEV